MKNKRTSKRGRKPKVPEETVEKKIKLHKELNFESIEPDPIIDHLKEYSQNNPDIRLISVDTQLLDQIALEGLSGITLRRLFRLVEVIYPSLNCTKDVKCQSFIWSIIVNKFLRYPGSSGIRVIYLKPTATATSSPPSSQPTTLQRQATHETPDNSQSSTISISSKIIIDKEIRLPSQTVKRIAKSDTLLYPVQDGSTMGSCANYLDRLDITDKLLEMIDNYSGQDILESMYDLNDEYDLENVYFVASQVLRAKAILPNWSDPNIDIKLREYCALELIGRSRTLGTVFPNDKTLGRYRIMLEAKGFITQYQMSMNSPIEHHLKRFSSVRHLHKDYKSKRIETVDQKIVKRPLIREEKENRSSTGSEKELKCSDSEIDEEDDDYDDDDDDDDDDKDDLSVTNVRGTNSKAPRSVLCCHPGKIKPFRSILQTVYDFIAESTTGVTQLDMRRELHMPKFHIRNHIKNLVSLEMISSRPPANDSTWRIYFAPKSRKQKWPKKEDELVKPTGGVMASWDQADLRAKKIIGHKRSSFSQAEDSLLILCRIASVLIEPKLKLSWCVNKRLIRDLLHKELVESHDKTSDACLRRIKYLKRLPNNIMSINELTAELQDDSDIRRLLKPTRFVGRPKKRFRNLLRCIRSKIPRLLGIHTGSAPVLSTTLAPTTSTSTSTSSSLVGSNSSRLRLKQVNRSIISGTSSNTPSAATEAGGKINEASSREINDHEELKQKYELLDCQSVASIQRTPTYGQAKNVVDVKYNQASLVTMAVTLTGCLDRQMFVDRSQKLAAAAAAAATTTTTANQRSEGEASAKATSMSVMPSKQKRANLWLLDKFYSGYHDKLISSVLSKLNKRSLLTRKCSADQACLYKPRTKMSLKLNQSVLFLLNRYQSHSLLQLAQPISQVYKIDLSESNEMASIALLTSLCSLSSFDLDMRLRIPANVVGIDQGNENFKSLCARSSEGTREILARFMSRSGAAAARATALAASSCSPELSAINSGGVVARRPPRRAGRGKKEEEEAAGGGNINAATAASGTTTTMTTTITAASKSHCETNDATTVIEEANQRQPKQPTAANQAAAAAKMDDSRRALFLLRHELKAQALDKCGNLADCLVVQPCNVSFYSNRQVEANCGPLASFLANSKPLDPSLGAVTGGSGDSAEAGGQDQQRQQCQDNWLVKSYRLVPSPEKAGRSPAPQAPQDDKSTGDELASTVGGPAASGIVSAKDKRAIDSADKEADPSAAPSAPTVRPEEDVITGGGGDKLTPPPPMDRDRDFEARMRPVMYSARLWKRVNGTSHLPSLLKLIESLLSWTIIFPGVERRLLEQEFTHLMPREHLLELLTLMEELELISTLRLPQRAIRRPRLFGFSEKEEESPNQEHESDDEVAYECSPSAYVKFCQLLNYCQDP